MLLDLIKQKTNLYHFGKKNLKAEIRNLEFCREGKWLFYLDKTNLKSQIKRSNTV